MILAYLLKKMYFGKKINMMWENQENPEGGKNDGCRWDEWMNISFSITREGGQ